MGSIIDCDSLHRLRWDRCLEALVFGLHTNKRKIEAKSSNFFVECRYEPCGNRGLS